VDVLVVVYVMPPAAGALDTHALPVLVSTFPDAPDAVNPVPPDATGSAAPRVKAAK